MPRRKQEQPKRLAYNGNGEEETGGELGEEEDWFGNASETPSEVSYLDVQEDLNASPSDRLHEQDTSPDSSLGSSTPIGSTLELLGAENDQLKDALEKADVLSPAASPALHEIGAHILHKPLSSNLRRLLEAGSMVAGASPGVTEKEDVAVSLGSALPLSPSSPHALQLNALARKLAAKHEQNHNTSPSNCFVWDQETWLHSSSSCSLSPASAAQQLKAAANAALLDKNLLRAEEPVRFSPYAPSYSPIQKQSASSALAALSKKVSERNMSSAHDNQRPAGSFLSLASMTSSAALLKEVAARAAGNMLVERKDHLIPGDVLRPLEIKQEKLVPTSALEMLLPGPMPKSPKSVNPVPEEDGGKSFQCPICGLVIKRKSYWKRHMVIHTGLKSHQCPLCPFRCARKDNLKSHMKQVHQHQDRGETFHCELCPFTSSRHFSLKLHMRCHQHFPRTEVKVKEEITETEVERSLFNEAAEKRKQGIELLGNPLKIQDVLLSEMVENYKETVILPPKPVKEEPRDLNVARVSVPAGHVFGKGPEAIQEDGRESREPCELTATHKVHPFSQDISAKTATDFLLKLSAANQRGELTPKLASKDEPKDRELLDPILSPRCGYQFGSEPPTMEEPPERLKKTSEGASASELFSQDISCKVASELLFKLSAENKKVKGVQMGTIKQEPMDMEMPEHTASPLSSCLFSCKAVKMPKKSERSTNSPEVIPRTEIQLFTQDISVKMASELLYQLSEKVSKAQEQGKESSDFSINSSLCEETFRSSVFTSSPRDFLPDLHGRLALQEMGKLPVELGNITPPWKFCEQLFPCKVCGKVFGRQQTLSRHLSLHTDHKVRTPSTLSPTSESKANPSFSSSSSSSSSSTLCDFVTDCEIPSSIVSNEDLGPLFNPPSASSGSSTSGSEEKAEKGFECVFCNFVCKTKMMYERHLQIHLITRMYECDVCHKFLKTPEQLLEHKKCHNVSTGGLKCPFCIYATNRPSAMECHLRTHYKMEFKCRICQVVKANQLDLEVHIREHRLGNHYKCDQCGYLSKTANKLIEHVRVHTGERPFHCDQCSYSCKRKDNLNLHKKLKHSPRQTLCCDECLFTTTHPFVFSRHVKKHQSLDYLEERKAQPLARKGGDALANSNWSLLSPLSVMSASQALQSVALSVTGNNGITPGSALGLFGLNGISAHLNKYRNCDLTHLIPLTTLFPHSRCEATFHSPRPQTAPPDTGTPKHSFLAYLGLTERADTV
ncbi:zinc finger protein 827 isoform X4 [Callorhinchus milii]|uniref:zinc finger protein 827 isoform X4 n=1 Tax=Callorhinchus milii TaxID=7868 RepID=UPI001C3FC622|nr:zinc finger protein 827 isoform X4 [Callorhinchus milii]